MVKNPLAKAEDTRDSGSISGLGRSHGEGNDNPLQFSCLEKSLDSRAWQGTCSPWGHKESNVTFTFSSRGGRDRVQGRGKPDWC